MRYPSYFNIYNASAGTGKTFNLVKDYLVLIIRSNNILLFKKILVITFTNKAVNEMKSRIMKYLTAYANSNELDNIMLEIIMNETGLTKSEVANIISTNAYSKLSALTQLNNYKKC